jgi:hypothetical protein
LAARGAPAASFLAVSANFFDGLGEGKINGRVHADLGLPCMSQFRTVTTLSRRFGERLGDGPAEVAKVVAVRGNLLSNYVGIRNLTHIFDWLVFHVLDCVTGFRIEIFNGSAYLRDLRKVAAGLLAWKRWAANASDQLVRVNQRPQTDVTNLQ